MTSSKKRLIAALVLSLLVFLRWRAQCLLAAKLALGGVLAAFLLQPACGFFSRKTGLNRNGAVLAGFLAALGAAAALLALLLPPLIGQLNELFAAMPRLIKNLDDFRIRAEAFLAERGIQLPEGVLPGPDILSGAIPLWNGTAALGRSAAGAIAEFAVMITLGYYFIRDRETLCLRLELLVPSARRRVVLRTAAAIRQEIGAYLRCQLLISMIVAALAAFFLLLCGVRAWLALGLIVGLFNLIPYFGPLLGGLPAMLMALTGGLNRALLTAVSLLLVQQIDNMLISPRVMGAVTGLHPALVLVAITVGGSLSGIGGMLFSVPVLLIIRAIARNWPVPCKNV